MDSLNSLNRVHGNLRSIFNLFELAESIVSGSIELRTQINLENLRMANRSNNELYAANANDILNQRMADIALAHDHFEVIHRALRTLLSDLGFEILGQSTEQAEQVAVNTSSESTNMENRMHFNEVPVAAVHPSHFVERYSNCSSYHLPIDAGNDLRTIPFNLATYRDINNNETRQRALFSPVSIEDSSPIYEPSDLFGNEDNDLTTAVAVPSLDLSDGLSFRNNEFEESEQTGNNYMFGSRVHERRASNDSHENAIGITPTEAMNIISSTSQGHSNSTTLRCSICLHSYMLNRPTCATCGHIFCRSCIEMCVRQYGRCPICNRQLTRFDLSRVFL